MPGLDIPADFQQWRMINEEAHQAGVNPDLIHRIVQQESGYDPQARSSQGALGLMQLMPDTAKQLGVDPLDPRQNVRGGIQYIKQLASRFGGDEKLIAAGYHSGPNAAERALANPAGNPKTAAYVANVAKEGEDPNAAPEAAPDIASDFANWRAEQQQQPSAPEAQAGPVERFAKGAWENLNPMGLVKAVLHPVDTVNNLVAAGQDQLAKAKDNYHQGRYVEAAGHGLAGIIPAIGPAAARAGEAIAGGDVAGGLGQAAGLIGAPEAYKLPGRILQPAMKASGLRVANSYLKPTKTLKLQNPDIPPAEAVLKANVPLYDADAVQAKLDPLNAAYDKAITNDPTPLSLDRHVAALEAMRDEWMHQGNAQPDIRQIQAVIDNLKSNPLYSKDKMGTVQVPQQVQVPHPTAVDAQGNPILQTTTQLVPQQQVVGREMIPQTAEELSRMKSNLQAGLKGKYGVEQGATVEAEKALARSIKQQINTEVPEAGAINAQRQPLVVAKKTINAANMRRENNHPIGLMGQVAAAGAEGIPFMAAEGHPVMAALSAVPLGISAALRNKYTASGVARGLYKAGTATLPTGAKQLAKVGLRAGNTPPPSRPVGMGEAQRLYQLYLSGQR